MYFDYFLKHYRLIAIDLSKQIELEKSDLRQYFFFILKDLKKIMEQQCSLSLKNQKKRLLIIHKVLYTFFYKQPKYGLTLKMV